jgi:DNA repair photolyase
VRPVDNPRQRFETSYVEWLEEPPPAALEVYEETATRSILSENDSPDIPFRWSVNPYRGCSHACAYCLSGDTLILMADSSARPLRNVRVGDEIYGTVRAGAYRRFVRTRVLDRWTVVKPGFRVTLRDGRSFVTSGDHRFLARRGWKFAWPATRPLQRPYLTTNDALLGCGTTFVDPPAATDDYRAGWLCGMVRGDALVASYDYSGRRRARDVQHQFRLALVDLEALQRAAVYLRSFDVQTEERAFLAAAGDRRAVRAVRTHARAGVERVREITAWPATASECWWKGFLAGIFDAEGSCSRGVLRISNTDPEIIDRVTDGLARFGFHHALERIVRPPRRPIAIVRLLGGLPERLRFFQLTGPAVTRKLNIAGGAVKNRAAAVARIEPLGVNLPLHDITTGTGDFVANGVISHNCYARPTHEYLGYGAGTDFETRLVAKLEAPRLLREALRRPSWRRELIAFSGDTDCYQPIEATYELTRQCLEACRDARNPVSVVTKSFLVSRDVGLLVDLAARARVSVMFSVAFDDDALARKVEPGAPRPSKRLEAMRVLSEAGIRTGVLFAPIIPGLNEDAIPAVLERAREAGARVAYSQLLRLPHAVKEVFLGRMADQLPDRVRRIEARIRDVRGGGLSEARFGDRMVGKGSYWHAVEQLFDVTARRLGYEELEREQPAEGAAPPEGEQLDLF